LPDVACRLQAKKYDRAIALLVKHGWWERLLTLMRSLDKTTDVKPITAAVAAFRRAGVLCYKHLPQMGCLAYACLLCITIAFLCLPRLHW
jgi:hypothetical protein